MNKPRLLDYIFVVLHLVLPFVDQVLQFAGFCMQLGLQGLEMGDKLVTHLQRLRLEGVVPAKVEAEMVETC